MTLHRSWLAVIASLCLACSSGRSGGESARGASTSESATSGEASEHKDDKDHKDEKEHEELPKRVQLTPAVIEAAKIRTEPIKRESIALTLSLPGEIGADPDRTARVSAPVDGRVERVMLKEGVAVKKGDPLAVLRVPEIGKARGALAAAQAKAKAARANADRLKHLVDQGLASAQERENAVAEASAYEAEARALSSQLSAMGTGGGGASITLSAPLAGVVIARDAIVGQPVTGDTILATIADLSEVWFLGRVFEKDLGRVREGAKVLVTLNAYPRERFPGVLEYLGKQIDPIARTLIARVRLVNRDDKLRLGLFGAAQVEVDGASARAATLIVPRSALIEVAGKPVVFVREPDGDFELHDVTLGESALDKVEVLAGLREGEAVVVEGAFTLKSAVLKSAFAEEE